MTEKLRHKDIWNGEYRNIKYEIVYWRLGGNCEGSYPCWNYYICLPIVQIPEKAQHFFILRAKKSTLPSGWYHFDYCSKPIISELDWHGGLTFYEKVWGDRGELIGIKLGCDYAHNFDRQRGYAYSVDYVTTEAKHSIDKLCELIPDLKVPCSWNGKYYNESEGRYNEQGIFTSYEGQEKAREFESPNPD